MWTQIQRSTTCKASKKCPVLKVEQALQLRITQIDNAVMLQTWYHSSFGCCTPRCASAAAGWGARGRPAQPDQPFSTTWLLWNQLSWHLLCTSSCSPSALPSCNTRMQKMLKLMHQRPLPTGVSLPQVVVHNFVLLTATVPAE